MTTKTDPDLLLKPELTDILVIDEQIRTYYESKLLDLADSLRLFCNAADPETLSRRTWGSILAGQSVYYTEQVDTDESSRQLQRYTVVWVDAPERKVYIKITYFNLSNCVHTQAGLEVRGYDQELGSGAFFSATKALAFGRLLAFSELLDSVTKIASCWKHHGDLVRLEQAHGPLVLSTAAPAPAKG